ncbi:MAG: porin, partial [Planctomycetaceae bacterium]
MDSTSDIVREDESQMVGFRAFGPFILNALTTVSIVAALQTLSIASDPVDDRYVPEWLRGTLEDNVDTEDESEESWLEADTAGLAVLEAPEAEESTFDDELAALKARINDLENSERKRLASEAAKKEDEAKKASDWQDMSTDKWTVKLGGHVSMDYVNWAGAESSIPNTQDYFEFRRLRLIADGTGYGTCDFRLQMTLEPESIGESTLGSITSPDVKDAYFTMNEIPVLGRVRIGNFFVPFSLEQVTPGANTVFMERSIPTHGVFSPVREVGVASYNCTDDQSITWASGVFFDSISEGLKERVDDNQGYRVSGRLTWTPLYDEPSNGRYVLYTGAGILHTDDQDNRVRFRARPDIHEGPRLIDSGILNADTYTSGNVEMAIVMGPVTLQSEAFLTTVDMNSGERGNVSGAYAHISYFLTGENRAFEKFGANGPSFGRTLPHSNFFVVPGAFSPGAWELKARYSNLNLDEFNEGQYNDLTTGFNWYWSDRTRIMFDWI